MHKALAFLARDCGFGVPSGVRKSRVAQRKRAGPITQRSMDRKHPLLGKPRQLKMQRTGFVNIEIISLVHYIDEAEAEAASQQTSPSGLMDEALRAGPITQRSMD